MTNAGGRTPQTSSCTHPQFLTCWNPNPHPCSADCAGNAPPGVGESGFFHSHWDLDMSQPSLAALEFPWGAGQIQGKGSGSPSTGDISTGADSSREGRGSVHLLGTSPGTHIAGTSPGKAHMFVPCPAGLSHSLVAREHCGVASILHCVSGAWPRKHQ